MELEMDFVTSGILLQKFCSCKRMSIFQSSRLVSQVHMMAGQNVNRTCLMCQIRIKMLKQRATTNSSLRNLKIYSSAEKLVKDEYM